MILHLQLVVSQLWACFLNVATSQSSYFLYLALHFFVCFIWLEPTLNILFFFSPFSFLLLLWDLDGVKAFNQIAKSNHVESNPFSYVIPSSLIQTWGQSYKTFYTVGRCKIKCLNCQFNEKENVIL